jgi:hypothetical protein
MDALPARNIGARSIGVLGDVSPKSSGVSAGTVIFLVVVAIAVVLIVLGLIVVLRRRRHD